ncbi:MAG: iron-sulfur cluster assembly accessory protein [Micavibrio aeruginosavorus]|nr:iron-sulfur cluster assembly accessory protein [Micavibrio aeruginosavorus]
MITITDEGIKAIKEKTALKDGAVGLRLAIKTTGCSGYSYKMEHAMSEDPMDDKFEQDGAVLYVPKMHSWMLAGMVVDYAQDKMQSGFTFTNPNEVSRCGCGQSFTVDPKMKAAP